MKSELFAHLIQNNGLICAVAIQGAQSVFGLITKTKKPQLRGFLLSH